MKPIRFHPDARSEMLDAAVYDESRQEHLGKRFLASVSEALARIRIFPEVYPIVETGVRRCLTKTFFPMGFFSVKRRNRLRSLHLCIYTAGRATGEDGKTSRFHALTARGMPRIAGCATSRTVR